MEIKCINLDKYQKIRQYINYIGNKILKITKILVLNMGKCKLINSFFILRPRGSYIKTFDSKIKRKINNTIKRLGFIRI